MIKRRRIFAIIVVILGLFSLIVMTGCDSLGMNPPGGIPIRAGDNNNNGNSGSTEVPRPSQTEGENPDTGIVAQPIVEMPEILVPTASGIAVEENGQAIVDFSNKQDGYIMAKFLESTDMKVKILITGPDGMQYQYTLRPNRDFEVFPLSVGNGVYEIGVFKQVEGTRYSMVLSMTIDVILVDEFAPFLRPNQFVNFNQDSNAVKKAAELVAGADTFMDKVGAIYHFVITNIEYDVHLAETVQTDYLPEIDRILASGKGICFDYAALMAAMLRSQGIPTKLVIGYTGDVYHAWISVYSKEDGWLDDVIFFDGSTWRLMDPTFAASGSSAAVAQYIGDGTNYVVRFIH